MDSQIVENQEKTAEKLPDVIVAKSSLLDNPELKNEEDAEMSDSSNEEQYPADKPPHI